MDNVINNITSSIDNCISEMREAAKHHAHFVQDNSEMVISGLETAKEIIKEEVEKAAISANKEAFKSGDKFVLEIGEKRKYFDEYSIVGTDLYVQTYLLKKLPKLNPFKEEEQQWIPFETRPLTEEEKEEHPEWDCILNCKLPDDGQRILVTIRIRGDEEVQQDEFYSDDGSYLDSGYEIGTEAVAWMPLPTPWRG